MNSLKSARPCISPGASDKEYKFPGAPVKMSATPWLVNTKLPTSGEYNSEVYHQILGLSEAEIEQLAQEGVI